MTAKMPATETPRRDEAALPEAPSITAFMARQRASRFVFMNLTSQLRAEEPTLRPGGRPCWSVPLALTMPGFGSLGTVGELLVDAETGVVLADAADVERMTQDAKRLARRAGL